MVSNIVMKGWVEYIHRDEFEVEASSYADGLAQVREKSLEDPSRENTVGIRFGVTPVKAGSDSLTQGEEVTIDK